MARKKKQYTTASPPPKQGAMGKRLKEYRKSLRRLGGRKT